MEKVVTDVTANDGYWHHICFTWSSIEGTWVLYKDGVEQDKGKGLAAGTYIPSKLLTDFIKCIVSYVQ